MHIKIFATRNHSYMVIVFCLLTGAILDGVEILSTTAYATTLSTRHSYIVGYIAYFVRRNAAGYILVYK
ncbi:hypothetical protein HanPSC8_Chr07g0304851 [Helianthus annuus]|nr:hypothetical protein HanIR_Chr07g0340521 [Helianthus annuus]KAJ0906383.1 hypothetical protein HanPSC8_Chr07g0304851 [Helianthus annuus]